LNTFPDWWSSFKLFVNSGTLFVNSQLYFCSSFRRHYILARERRRRRTWRGLGNCPVPSRVERAVRT